VNYVAILSFLMVLVCTKVHFHAMICMEMKSVVSNQE